MIRPDAWMARRLISLLYPYMFTSNSLKTPPKQKRSEQNVKQTIILYHSFFTPYLGVSPSPKHLKINGFQIKVAEFCEGTLRICTRKMDNFSIDVLK